MRKRNSRVKAADNIVRNQLGCGAKFGIFVEDAEAARKFQADVDARHAAARAAIEQYLGHRAISSTVRYTTLDGRRFAKLF
jgi:hypothetical protein